jgi:redox-sensitive bicupin YhaK (pirin superfamily)
MSFVFKPQWVNEGKGAKVIRIIGNQHLKKMDPFLMLDLAKVKLPAGFPDHPHRGFETVSYMLKGSFYHEDSKGHKGKIEAGDIQWMTAGRGIMHSEMPGSFEEESYGFQLWINLRKELKMIQPQYQEYKSNQLQIIELEKSTVKIISGEWKGKKGPILARTPTYYFDISLKEDGDFDIPIPKKWNTLVFVYEGKLNYTVNGKTREIDEFYCCVL